MQKKTKIIIAIVCAVVIAVGVSLGIYFGTKNDTDPTKTVFAKTGTVDIFDKNTVKFYYITPLIEKGSFELIDKKAFVVETEGKTIEGKIVSVEYRPNDSEKVKSGEIVVTADLSEKLAEGKSYKAVIKAGAIEHKKEEYVNPDIIAEFKVKKDDNGVLHAEEERFQNSKAVVLSDVEPELYKKDGKAYFTVTAKADGITKYNKDEAANLKVFVAYSYKKESEGVFVRWVNTDVVFSAKDGVITLTGTTLEDDLVPGRDYKLVIKKGFFTNDDLSIVNEEYEGNFTYVEK